MTKDEIIGICNKYKINNYIINDDLSISVIGDVLLRDFNLENIPLNFNVIYGDFIISFNKLTSLKGCPKHIGGTFYCSHNKLTNLENSPFYIKHDFDLIGNPLQNIDGLNVNYDKLIIVNKEKLIKNHKRKLNIKNILNNI